jgi:hypothetical protein
MVGLSGTLDASASIFTSDSTVFDAITPSFVEPPASDSGLKFASQDDVSANTLYVFKFIVTNGQSLHSASDISIVSNIVSNTMDVMDTPLTERARPMYIMEPTVSGNGDTAVFQSTDNPCAPNTITSKYPASSNSPPLLL